MACSKHQGEYCKDRSPTSLEKALKSKFGKCILKYLVSALPGRTNLYLVCILCLQRSAHNLKIVYNLVIVQLQASIPEQSDKELKGQLEVHLIKANPLGVA